MRAVRTCFVDHTAQREVYRAELAGVISSGWEPPRSARPECDPLSLSTRRCLGQAVEGTPPLGNSAVPQWTLVRRRARDDCPLWQAPGNTRAGTSGVPVP